MLFDLRGRGRRRTIQGIYLFLALLMGGGLVFFGVGGTGVGLFNNDNNGSSGGSGTNPITAQLKTAQRRVRLQPKNPAAWAFLTRQLYANAQSGKNIDQNTQKLTASGVVQMRQADAAFQRYLALNPPKLDVGLIRLMISAYGAGGLNNPAKATTAAEALTQAQPKSWPAFAQLAISAFQAGQTHKSALAEQAAVDLGTSKAQKSAIKSYVDQQKASSATGQQTQTSTSLPGG
jgi:hypothetical protein